MTVAQVAAVEPGTFWRHPQTQLVFKVEAIHDGRIRLTAFSVWDTWIDMPLGDFEASYVQIDPATLTPKDGWLPNGRN